MDKNKRIAEWLGLCWHEFKLLTGPYSHCRCGLKLHFQLINTANSDYSTWQGFGQLIEALKAKGISADIVIRPTQMTMVALWQTSEIYREQPDAMAFAEEAQVALLEAVIQLIETGDKQPCTEQTK